VRAGASLLFAAEVGALAHRRDRRRVGIGWARGTGRDRKDGGDRETRRYNSTARGSRVRANVLIVSPLSISFAEPGRLWMLPPPTVAMFGSFYSHYTGIRGLDVQGRDAAF
jgi:hypothetical protein